MPTPSRRHRSPQRERLLAVLRARTDHPTARVLHRSLHAEFPRLSLGTVYRNLEVLLAEGRATEVDAGGVRRFDARTDPHHHFVCERCGSMGDLTLREPRGWRERLAREQGLAIEQIRIHCRGLCARCASLASTGFSS